MPLWLRRLTGKEIVALTSLVVGSLLLETTGCGYVGPVLPPSPQVPGIIGDLMAVERADQLVITFTTPSRTTDNLPIRELSDIQVLVAEGPLPLNEAEWLNKARVYPIALPSEGRTDVGQAIPVTRTLPVQDWLGKHIVVLARTAIKSHAGFSALSKPVQLDVVAPLKPPDISIAATAEGYKLTWKAYDPSVNFRILRKGPEDKTEIQIGSAQVSEYTDSTSIWDTLYTYRVVAILKNAESLPSDPKKIIASDTFAPAVPTDVSVFDSADAAEISWRRSPEADTAGYKIYRSVNDGPFSKLDAQVSTPAYTDRQVEHGKTYRYQITAFDVKGNESGRSATVELHFQ